MHIIGRKPVLEALRAGERVSKIYFLFGIHGEPLSLIRREARLRSIAVIDLPKNKFERFTALGNTQGVVALVEEIRTCDLDELLDGIPGDDKTFLLALDTIQDPHNVGAILRTAECAGVHGIILPQRDTAPLTETVLKASAGAATHLRIAKVVNLAQALSRLKRERIWIVGLDDRGTTDLFRFDADMPLCIVVGNEGRGMRPGIRKLCDVAVRIPMWGRISSLNASVAAALALFEVRRAREE